MKETPSEAPVMPGSREERSLFSAVAVVCALASFGLLLSLATLIGDRAARDYIDTIGHARGVTLEVGQIGFHLLDGVTLSDVSLRKVGATDLRVEIDEVATGMGVVELLTGQRRPNALVLRGVRAEGAIDERQLSTLMDGRQRQGGSAERETWSSSPSKLTLEDVQANLVLSYSHQGMVVVNQALRLTAFDGQLVRGAGWEIDAEATLLLDGEVRTLTFTTPSANVQHVALDQPLGLQFLNELPGPVVTFQGLSFDRAARAVSVEGVAAKAWDRTFELDSLAYRGSALTKLPPRLVLRGLNWRDDRAQYSIAAVDVAFDQPATHSLPIPVSVVIDGIELLSRDGRVSTVLDQVALALVDKPIERLMRREFVGLIKSVLVRGAKLHAQVLAAELAPQSRREVSAVLETQPGLPHAFDGPLTLPVAPGLLRQALKVPVVVQGGALSLSTGANDKAPQVQVSNLNAHLEPVESEGMMVAFKGLIDSPKDQPGRLHANGYISPKGELRGLRGTIAGTHVASALSTLSPYVTVEENAWLKLDFDYVFKAGLEAGHRVIGEVAVENFGFEAWRVSHTPIGGLTGRVAYDALLSPSTRTIDVELSAIHVGELMLRGKISAGLPHGGRPKLSAELQMPTQDCAAALGSIPPGLMPRLKGLTVEGQLGFKAAFEVDLADVSSLSFDVEGEADTCRTLTLGTELDLAALRGPFIHHPFEPKRGRRTDIAVGRGTKQWVPSNQLPHFVKAAARVTEDRRFKHHKGVRWDLIEKAMRMNLDKGKFAYGGSTITQQLVKNLFLTREKTLSRKLEELIIAWEIERRFEKREILELYLNVIEFGPDLYGIRHASHHYFGKPPGHLSPAEAAFIMGLKPYPAGGHRQWASGRLNGWWVKRVKNILDTVRRREGAITLKEFTSAAPYQVRFRKAGMSYWSGKRYLPPGSTANRDPGRIKGQ